MEKLKLSPPWVTFVHEIQALFAYDEEVKVVYDEENYEVKLFVDNSIKADALQKLLPDVKVFGNVTLKISVVPANNEEREGIDLFNAAFSNNPIMAYTKSATTPFGVFNYVVFKPEVVQFFNDQMDDVNGSRSTLYQEIAKDVFGDDHAVFFCTDKARIRLGAPLGEWP